MKWLGNLLILAGLIILILIFGPVFKEEVEHRSNKMMGIEYLLKEDYEEQLPVPDKFKLLEPVNRDFALVIPKININAPVFADIDSGNQEEYLPVLREGVAHALGSVYPGEEGNVFLFAHSTDAFYNVGRYNAVFFLIGKLQPDDEINIYYQQKRYRYLVYEKAVVTADNLTDFLEANIQEKTLTLQTCYPPGTTLRRLVVLAREAEPE